MSRRRTRAPFWWPRQYRGGKNNMYRHISIEVVPVHKGKAVFWDGHTTKYIVSVDAALKEPINGERFVGLGIILRFEDGREILMGYKFLRTRLLHIEMFEMEAILLLMRFIDPNKYPGLTIECDNESVIDALNCKSRCPLSCMEIAKEVIRLAADKFWSKGKVLLFKSVERERNMVADRVADIAIIRKNSKIKWVDGFLNDYFVKMFSRRDRLGIHPYYKMGLERILVAEEAKRRHEAAMQLVICRKCHIQGHRSKSCPNAGDDDTSDEDEGATLYCSYCDKEDHIRRDCPYDICLYCSKRRHTHLKCPQLKVNPLKETPSYGTVIFGKLKLQSDGSFGSVQPQLLSAHPLSPSPSHPPPSAILFGNVRLQSNGSYRQGPPPPPLSHLVPPISSGEFTFGDFTFQADGSYQL